MRKLLGLVIMTSISVADVQLASATPQKSTSPVKLDDDDHYLLISQFLDSQYIPQQFILLRCRDITNGVSEVVKRLVGISLEPGISFHVRVLNDYLPIVAASRGYIYISSGALDIAENDDELAAAIAHTIAHVNLKHQFNTYRFFEQQLAAEVRKVEKRQRIAGIVGILGAVGGGLVAGATMGGALGGVTGTVLSSVVGGDPNIKGPQLADRRPVTNRLGPHSSLNLLTLILFKEVYQGYGLEEEVAADKLAIEYLRKAGYDPNSLSSLLSKVASLGSSYEAKGYWSHFLSMQPGLQGRLEHVHKTKD